MGGDDDKLEGFLNDDDVIDFESLSKKGKSKENPSGASIFGKLTSVF